MLHVIILDICSCYDAKRIFLRLHCKKFMFWIHKSIMSLMTKDHIFL